MANKWINPLNSRLDADQTTIRAYDETLNRHRVDALVTATLGSVDVIIDAETGDNIAIQDSEGNELNVTPEGYIGVIVEDITLDHTNDSVEVFQATHDNLNSNANVQQNNTDVSVSNPLYTQTTNGSLEATQQQVLAELQNANSSLDNIETDADAIRVAVQSIDTDIDVQLSTRSSEATQLNVLAELQATNTSLDNIEADAESIRVETVAINAELDTQTTILNNIDTDTSNIIVELQSANSSLDAIESDIDVIRLQTIDINTELNTQTAILTDIENDTDAIITELQAANSSLDAIESDVDAIRVATQSIDTDFDVALSTRASESTLSSVLTQVSAINANTDTLESLLAQDLIGGVVSITDVNNRTNGQITQSSAIDTLNYGTLIVGVYASHSGSFTIEWSHTGTSDWVQDGDVYDVAANLALKTTTYGPKLRYARVVYTNGATTTTTFLMSAVLKRIHTKPSSHKASEPFNDSTDLEGVKAVLTGKSPNNTYGNISVQGISNANSTDTPLAASAIFRGEWFNWQASYIQLIVDITADVSGTLFIDFSQLPSPVNGSDVSITGDPILRSYDPTLTPLYKIHVPVQSRWVRVRYVNGPAGQSVFNLDSAFTTVQSGSYASSLFGLPDVNTLTPVVRSVLTVPSGVGMGFQNFPVTSLGNPKVSIQEINDDISVAPLDTVVFSQQVIGTTASRVDLDSPSNRRVFKIKNSGPGRIAYGTSPSLTFNSQSNTIEAREAESILVPASVNIYAIAENTGGTQTTLQRSPASASGTATNPNNAISNNASYAVFTAAAQTITATGYAAGTANPLVSVKLGIDANKQSGQTETATVAEFQSGATAGAGTVVSSSLAGGSNQLYVAIITRNNNAGTVNMVTGGGVTFTATSQINITSGNRRIDVWSAYGTFTSGAVTASLSTSTNAHIAVYRITNADPTTPIQTINNTTGTGTAVTGPGIAGTDKGLAIIAVSHVAASGTPGAGYTENVDFTNGIGGNADGLITANKSLVSTGTETGTYTLNAVSAWAAIGITILPSTAINPVVTLSYTLSAVPGATSGQVILSSSSDVSTTVDVTADRAWVVGDIVNVNVIATATTLSAAQANIDWLYLEIVDTTGNTARLQIYQAGKTI